MTQEAAMTDNETHFSMTDPACEGCAARGCADECFNRAECMAGPCPKFDAFDAVLRQIKMHPVGGRQAQRDARLLRLVSS